MISGNVHRLPPTKPEQVMTLIRDASPEWIENYLEVYVVGDEYEQRAFAEFFVRSRCSKVDLPEDADVVVFTGGVDVNPELYGETRHASTQYDDGRDLADFAVYQTCLELGIPMFGVCRGAQFLHVMNGGKLFQDVDNHHSPHKMWDIRHKKWVDRVSSVHHQSCINNSENGMELLANCFESRERWRNATDVDKGSTDIEAFFYRDTGCFGVQGHPEYKGYTEFSQWTLKMLNELFVENPDFELRGGVRRMKKDLLALRKECHPQLACVKTVLIN